MTITNHTTFACPHCGAPGWVEFGEAKYTCLCRLRAPAPNASAGFVQFICANCGAQLHGDTSGHRCIPVQHSVRCNWPDGCRDSGRCSKAGECQNVLQCES